jgi:hypothetical protein
MARAGGKGNGAVTGGLTQEVSVDSPAEEFDYRGD